MMTIIAMESGEILFETPILRSSEEYKLSGADELGLQNLAFSESWADVLEVLALARRLRYNGLDVTIAICP